MARSLRLWLYLLLARRPGAPPRAGGAVLALPPSSADGPLLWLHSDPATPLASLGHLSRQMLRARPNLRFLITQQETPPELEHFPPGSLSEALPADRFPDLRAFIARHQPSMILVTGLSLPPALIEFARVEGLSTVLLDSRLAVGSRPPWRWRRRMAAALLQRVTLILARDRETATALGTIARAPLPIEVTGRLEETNEPLPASEAEREVLANQLRGRAVWFAVHCPEQEEAAVIAAHARALRLAHRMLLVIAPADPGGITRIEASLDAAGMSHSRRSRDQEPTEDVQVFIADSEGELGLWYRLAPVTFMGGTLIAGGTGRNPMEPAALGSAIVHGPNPGPYPEAYARLAEAFAARAVSGLDSLSQSIADLISPDKAAFLAHNAWAASSGGAEVTERVMQIVFARLDAAPVRSSAPIQQAAGVLA